MRSRLFEVWLKLFEVSVTVDITYLLQANDGNVEIGRSDDADSDKTVNTATMKVLSRQQRFEDLHNYQAPSLQRHEAD